MLFKGKYMKTIYMETVHKCWWCPFSGLIDDRFQINELLKYEFLFGEGFISPGGKEQNRKLLQMLNLTKGKSIENLTRFSALCHINVGDGFKMSVINMSVWWQIFLHHLTNNVTIIKSHPCLNFTNITSTALHIQVIFKLSNVWFFKMIMFSTSVPVKVETLFR